MISILSRIRSADQQTQQQRPLVVLGSSSSEVFDYIFGDRPDYHPFWASGWSARGLRSPNHTRYLEHILTDVPRSATVLLNFGCTDVNFNARHMASTRGIYDFSGVLNEALAGILTASRHITGMGFRNVRAVFISPVISLPQAYWSRFSKGRQLPDRMLGRMYHDLCRATARQMPTIDSFRDLTDGAAGGYLLKPEFMRPVPNHHPDYIKIQRVIWNRVSAIPGVPPRREEWLDQHYDHVPAHIKRLMAASRTRPRTCR